MLHHGDIKEDLAGTERLLRTSLVFSLIRAAQKRDYGRHSHTEKICFFSMLKQKGQLANGELNEDTKMAGT